MNSADSSPQGAFIKAGRKPGNKALVQTSLSYGIVTRKQPMLGYTLPSGDSMVVRNMPPGRTSTSASMAFHGKGQNLCLISSGSVHARQSSRGGTSTTRSKVKSNLLLKLVVIRFLLG